MKKNPKVKNIVYNTLIGVFGIVFLISLYQIVDYYVMSYKEDQAFKDIIEQVENIKKPTSTSKPNATKDPQTSEEPEIQLTEDELVFQAYESLHEQNDDFSGWIKIEGTKVNYPVMLTPENPEFYLRRGFDKSYAESGVIFVGEGGQLFPKSDNFVLYGHNMNDGTMFHDILQYNNAEFLNDHSIIEFDTLDTRAKYEVFSCFSIDVSKNNGHYDYYNFINSDDGEEFDEFVKFCKDNSKYNIDVTPERGDKFITLSTCDYSSVNGRFVVVAREIKE